MADLRIEKTRKALKRAFLELLEKESFENITVAELCDLAEVRRATFYTHFPDKYSFPRNDGSSGQNKLSGHFHPYVSVPDKRTGPRFRKQSRSTEEKLRFLCNADSFYCSFPFQRTSKSYRNTLASAGAETSTCHLPLCTANPRSSSHCRESFIRRLSARGRISFPL